MVKIRERRSVSRWIARIKTGDSEAAVRLWQRYFDALVRVARKRLRGAPRAVADEEDAALSAFDSFCRGAAGGQYPEVGDRGDLWRLLVVITKRKVIDQIQRQRQKKRGGEIKIGSLVLTDEEGEFGCEAAAVSGELDPGLVVMMADECHVLLGKLRDETLRQVALMRLEGYTSEEIADGLECSVRSVARKLELIRRIWQAEAENSS
jgi:DNA-directed RNA polymerase specialized sigma24 family protein